MIPEAILTDLRSRAGEEILPVRRLSGGSINEAVLVQMATGESGFLKWNRHTIPGMFEKEVRGLSLLRSAGSGIRIPEPVSWRENYLLLEYVPQGDPAPGAPGDFGRALARIHRVTSPQFGLDHDNFIGSLPQSNTLHSTWPEFFRKERIEPQLRMAVDAGRLPGDCRKQVESLFAELDRFFPDEPPALLHGDLWSGNCFYDDHGRPVMFDPAVYYGHREMELAFTRLFGGFSREFYRSYEEEYPLQPGFPERMDICNLYPLLVHTNLFGGSYGRQVQRIISRF